MPTSEVTYISELRVKSVHVFSGNEIITDAPLDNQGKAQAFSPTDLLATSLANCMLTIMGIAARTHQFSIDGTRAEVTKTMASDPRRVSAIEVKLFFPKNDYTDKHKKIIENAAHTCPVAYSLHPDIKQDISFNF